MERSATNEEGIYIKQIVEGGPADKVCFSKLFVHNSDFSLINFGHYYLITGTLFNTIINIQIPK